MALHPTPQALEIPPEPEVGWAFGALLRARGDEAGVFVDRAVASALSMTHAPDPEGIVLLSFARPAARGWRGVAPEALHLRVPVLDG